MNYFFILFIIAMDQVTKYFVHTRFQVNESIPIIKGIFHLTYVRNVGAAFGILQNQKMFFIVMTVLVISGILFFARKQNNMHMLLTYSLSAIIGGAIGNLIDRMRFGYVVDFFDFRIWPVFNIADISIVVGAGLLAYYMLFIDQSYVEKGR
ncbi:MAG: signal peptidase II [Bacillota bacterium]